MLRGDKHPRQELSAVKHRGGRERGAEGEINEMVCRKSLGAEKEDGSKFVLLRTQTGKRGEGNIGRQHIHLVPQRRRKNKGFSKKQGERGGNKRRS